MANLRTCSLLTVASVERQSNAVRFSFCCKMACVVFLFCMATAISSRAQTLTTLASFDKTDGRDPGFPAAPLVQGTSGNFYGTTVAGGAHDEGTVFEMTPAGELHTLYSFCSQPGCSDGAVANAGLIQATDGNFYGTTADGGINNAGTIFEITPAGMLTTRYRFCSQSGCPDGFDPSAGLLQAADGNLYGTTYAGGAFGSGSIFKITRAGALTTLASFNGTDGAGPDFGSLIQASDGNFYGTTIAGGSNGSICGSSNGCGTIFRVSPKGELKSLYSFCPKPNCADGEEPFGGLVQGANGNLYGTTGIGGANNYGTIFEITLNGKLSTLHSFDFSDGAYPEAALVLGTDGNLYGTTPSGIVTGSGGFVFRITPAGELTTLYNFCSEQNCSDGTGPFESVIQATNGTFYGATFAGGTSTNCSGGCGTVFSLSTGLGPFVKTVPAAGKVGSKVIILGNDLQGATSVTFNGTAATFKTSNSAILATVPSGATSGTVQVTTSSGTLSSNMAFYVLP
jgi:uncharacterized repeat protein (TIGR03803 family)